MNNAELIETLRHCGKEGGCLDCQFLREPSDACYQLSADAADLIEAQQKALDECAKQLADMAAKLEEERNKTVTEIFLEEQLWWEDRCKELEAERTELIAKCRRLEAQLPKEGEWIESNRRPRSAQFYCSVCHRTCYDIQPTRNKAWTKRCRYRYCPNCGARMKGEQE